MFKINKEVDPDNRIRCDCCNKLRTTTYHIVGEYGNEYEGIVVCRDGLHKLRKVLAVLTSPKRGIK